MAWWLYFDLWWSVWLVPVLGQAWVQWRPLCEAVRGDRNGPPSSFNFDLFGTSHRPICSMMRMCGDQDSRQGEHWSWTGR